MIALEHGVDRQVLHRFSGEGVTVDAAFCKVVQALVLRGEVARRQKRRAARNGERRDDLLGFLVNPPESIERHGLRLVSAFHHSELRRLLLCHRDSRRVRGHEHDTRGDDGAHRGHAHGLHGEIDVAVLLQVPRTHRQRDERAHDEQAHHHVRVAHERGVVERCGEEVGHERLRAVGRKLGAGGCLHPGVRDDDPQRGQARAKPHEPCGCQVELLRNFRATEQQHAQEHRLQEERQQRLGCQRRSENVAHEACVVSPVRTEAELHGDTGRHAERERGRENLHPEARRRRVFGLARTVVARFENRYDHAQADGHWYEDEVIHGRERKLNARQQAGIGQKLHSYTPFALNESRAARPRAGALDAPSEKCPCAKPGIAALSEPSYHQICTI